MQRPNTYVRKTQAPATLPLATISLNILLDIFLLMFEVHFLSEKKHLAMVLVPLY